jgi:hypothetical protein
MHEVAEMVNSETRILWIVVAVLLSVIAALIVAYLSYDGSGKKAVLAGLGAFGGAMVISITIEGELGLLLGDPAPHLLGIR